eukprot:SAG31_NODE_57_length_29727_cov_12.584568_28_plen_127_part_00
MHRQVLRRELATKEHELEQAQELLKSQPVVDSSGGTGGGLSEELDGNALAEMQITVHAHWRVAQSPCRLTHILGILGQGRVRTQIRRSNAGAASKAAHGRNEDEEGLPRRSQKKHLSSTVIDVEHH